MARLKQIHSDATFVAHEPGCIGEGDALVTRTPGVACLGSHRGLFSDSAGRSGNSRRRRHSCRLARDRRRCCRNDTRSNAQRIRNRARECSCRDWSRNRPVLLRSRYGCRAAVRNGASGKTRSSCGKPESAHRRGSPAEQDRTGWRLHFLQPCAILFLAPRSRPGRTDGFLHPRGRSLALAVQC